MSDNVKAAFIGLGVMGYPMAGHLRVVRSYGVDLQPDRGKGRKMGWRTRWYSLRNPA